MNLAVDAYAHLDSPLHRWEPRVKLVGLMALIFAFSFVRQLPLLPAMLLVTAALYAASHLPLSYLLTRLRYPGSFLLIMAVVLPFLSGSTVLFQIGPLALRLEGSLELLRILVKFVCILTIGLVLFGSGPFLSAIKAMRALGLPPILADMTLLAYRYLFEIGGDLSRMQTAMRLRGFKAHYLSGRGLAVLASLAGSILVRSYERSDRVYHAMMLRGYGQVPRGASDEFQTRPSDLIFAAAILLVAIGFVTAEILLRQGGQ
ncbi:MAG: cobalt ECF transporter T component CbiQ [Anaerolineae bacterium]|jgi:cobalt/nickel transport system permease protein